MLAYFGFWAGGKNVKWLKTMLAHFEHPGGPFPYDLQFRLPANIISCLM
jgi:hypothetical protein